MQKFTIKSHIENVYWFRKYAPIAHAAANAKGFYKDAPKIGKRGNNYEYLCKMANLINGKIGGAYESYCASKIKPNSSIFGTVRALLDFDKATFVTLYTDHIKGTLCEWLASVVIDSMAFAGSFGDEFGSTIICNEYDARHNPPIELVFNDAFKVASHITRFAETAPYNITEICLHLAAFFGIDIYACVDMKMAYNSLIAQKK